MNKKYEDIINKLQESSDLCTDENYHTEARSIDAIINVIDKFGDDPEKNLDALLEKLADMSWMY